MASLSNPDEINIGLEDDDDDEDEGGSNKIEGDAVNFIACFQLTFMSSTLM